MRNIIFVLILILTVSFNMYAQKNTINVGIIPFNTAIKQNKVTEQITSELSSELGKYKFIRLIERMKLNKILEELELGMTGVIDEKSISKTGKLHGVEIIIAGFIKKNKISGRAIHTESGRIIASESIVGNNNISKLSRILASQIESFLARENLKILRNYNDKINTDFWIKSGNKTIKTDDKIKVGKPINFHFKSDQNGYLTIVDIQSDGSVVILFPNDFSPDNKIIKNKTYTIPSKDAEYQITTSEPSGKDNVVAFFTKKRVDWLDKKKLHGKGFWTVKNYEKYNMTRGLQITSTKLKPYEWESNSVEFNVIE